MNNSECKNCENYIESKNYCLYFSEFIAGIKECHIKKEVKNDKTR